LPARAFGVVGEKEHGQWGTAPPLPTGYRLLCCYCAAAGKGTTTLRRLTGVRRLSGARTAGKRARGAPPLVCAAGPSCFDGERSRWPRERWRKKKRRARRRRRAAGGRECWKFILYAADRERKGQGEGSVPGHCCARARATVSPSHQRQREEGVAVSSPSPAARRRGRSVSPLRRHRAGEARRVGRGGIEARVGFFGRFGPFIPAERGARPSDSIRRPGACCARRQHGHHVQAACGPDTSPTYL
jgi:hypothetical protein